MKKLLILLALIAVSYNANAQETELMWARPLGGANHSFMSNEIFFLYHYNGEIYIHETATGDFLRQFKTDPTFAGLAIIPNRQEILVTGADIVRQDGSLDFLKGAQLKLYDTQSGRVIKEFDKYYIGYSENEKQPYYSNLSKPIVVENKIFVLAIQNNSFNEFETKSLIIEYELEGDNTKYKVHSNTTLQGVSTNLTLSKDGKYIAFSFQGTSKSDANDIYIYNTENMSLHWKFNPTDFYPKIPENELINYPIRIFKFSDLNNDLIISEIYQSREIKNYNALTYFDIENKSIKMERVLPPHKVVYGFHEFINFKPLVYVGNLSPMIYDIHNDILHCKLFQDYQLLDSRIIMSKSEQLCLLRAGQGVMLVKFHWDIINSVNSNQEIENISLQNGMLVLNNPYLPLQLDKLIISSIDGKQVFQTINLKLPTQIPLHPLPKGFYIINLNGLNFSKTFKFIVGEY